MKKVVFYLPNLDSGGVSKVVINLLNSLVKIENFKVSLLLNQLEGSFLSLLSPEVEVFKLNTARMSESIFALNKFITKEKPDVLLSGMPHVNTITLLTNFLKWRKTKVIIVEHGNLRESMRLEGNARNLILLVLMKILYPTADKVVSVSKGVEETLLEIVKIDSSKKRVIYNPVIDNTMIEKSEAKVQHKWLEPKQCPIILSVGRLSKEKDFEKLITAFSIVRSKLNAKLIIIGQGEERESLQKLIDSLNMQESIDLAGYEENPYKYFSKADLFVLSSKTEGLPTVLIEALALTRNILSTDCPSGPREVLNDGLFGEIVSMNGALPLAQGMIKMVGKTKVDSFSDEDLNNWLEKFTVKKVASEYLKLINEVI